MAKSRTTQQEYDEWNDWYAEIIVKRLFPIFNIYNFGPASSRLQSLVFLKPESMLSG